MIELDIKIRAKNHDNLDMLIRAMTDSLAVANSIGKIDVQFTAETDGDRMVMTRKEIIIPSDPAIRTTIGDFIAKSDLSVRSRSTLLDKPYAFLYAEDITKERFLKLRGVSIRSWEEVEEELKRQNIKY